MELTLVVTMALMRMMMMTMMIFFYDDIGGDGDDDADGSGDCIDVLYGVADTPGSTSITVSAKQGGLKLLQIQDNGHGIRR